jgi:S-adenosylmethionine hydrolase
MIMERKIIALLTDFGIDDPFVGIMKAVISEINPEPIIIDLTHQIPPGDIQRGAFVLWQAARDFPEGTIFLVVVDPGVGTQRKAVYYTNGKQVFICPDNGLLSYLRIHDQGLAWELSDPRFQRSNQSTTFHGRDIFAPAAAYAASGIRGEQFGGQLQDLVNLSRPILNIKGNSLSGEVLSVDHFGNLITSIGQFVRTGANLEFSSWISDEMITIPASQKIRVRADDQTFPLKETFGSVTPGEITAVIGSTGLLEISANQSSAQAQMGSKYGDRVELVWE